MMRIMDHKHIMGLKELYEGENYIYCLCELFDGGHLLNYIIKNGHLTEKDSLKFIKQLLKVITQKLPKNTKTRNFRTKGHKLSY